MTIKRLITVAFAAVFISVVSIQAQNTDTGKKQIPETTTGGKCKITTDTGNIIIEIVPD